MRLPLFMAISILSTPLFALEAEDNCGGSNQTAGGYSSCIQGNLDRLAEELATVYQDKLTKTAESEKEALVFEQTEWGDSVPLICEDEEDQDNATLCAFAMTQIRIKVLKGETPLEEKVTMENIEKAYQEVSNSGGGHEQTKKVCADKFSFLKALKLEFQYNLATNRCFYDVFTRLQRLEHSLKNGKEPTTCKEWAMRTSEEWGIAPLNMKYSPFNENTNPVRLEGSFETIGDGFYIKNPDGNVLISMMDDVLKLNVENISIGSDVIAYGKPVDKAKITLLSGKETVVPLVKVACIQGIK